MATKGCSGGISKCTKEISLNPVLFITPLPLPLPPAVEIRCPGNGPSLLNKGKMLPGHAEAANRSPTEPRLGV